MTVDPTHALDATYALKYFDLTNGIAAFAVVQMIAFLVALGTSDCFVEHIHEVKGWCMIKIATPVATGIYIIGVLGCGWAEYVLVVGTKPDAFWLVLLTAISRCIVIGIISVFGLIAVNGVEGHADKKYS